MEESGSLGGFGGNSTDSSSGNTMDLEGVGNSSNLGVQGTRPEQLDPTDIRWPRRTDAQACMQWVMKERKCGPFTKIATAVPMSGTFEGVARAWTKRAKPQ